MIKSQAIIFRHTFVTPALVAAAAVEGWSSAELVKPLSSTSCFTCASSSLLVSLVCVITPSVGHWL